MLISAIYQAQQNNEGLKIQKIKVKPATGMTEDISKITDNREHGSLEKHLELRTSSLRKERGSLKAIVSKVEEAEYPTKDELFEGSEDIQMTQRSNEKDHVLNTINGDFEHDNTFDKMRKKESFQSPKRVTSKRLSFTQNAINDIEKNVAEGARELTFQKEDLIKDDLLNDADKTLENV